MQRLQTLRFIGRKIRFPHPCNPSPHVPWVSSNGFLAMSLNLLITGISATPHENTFALRKLRQDDGNLKKIP
jgi:hypothetical protein